MEKMGSELVSTFPYFTRISIREKTTLARIKAATKVARGRRVR